MVSRLIKIGLAGIIVGFILTGCAPSNGQPETNVRSAEKVSLSFQLGWVHEYSAAGQYMAIENGRYSDENLTVTLIEGGFGETGFIEPIDAVVNGTADFGATSISSLLTARAAGKPVVAIATINQHSPFALISLADRGINRPRDLIGKTVSVAQGGAMLSYESFLSTQNIDPESVQLIPRTDFGVEPLINGDVDVLGGWIINENVALGEAGYETNFILLSDYAIDSYDTLIFTTEDMVNNRPDVVERFLRATLLGWQDVISNADQAAKITVKYGTDLVQEEQLRRLEAFIPLMSSAGSRTGLMSAEVWDFNYQLLLDGGLLEAPVDVQSAYTLSFLNRIYDDNQ